MSVTKSAASLKRDRKRIKTDLLAQLTSRGLCSAVNSDLVDDYLESRDDLVAAKTRKVELLDSGLDFTDDAVQVVDAVIHNKLAEMAEILNMLQISPKSSRRADLEAQIRGQLDIKGLKGPIFEDKIDTFCKLWDAFQDAVRCLNERGRTYFTVSSAGKNYEKDNAATKDIVTMAKAMQDMLDDLEITVKGWADADGNDDDL